MCLQTFTYASISQRILGGLVSAICSKTIGIPTIANDMRIEVGAHAHLNIGSNPVISLEQCMHTYTTPANKSIISWTFRDPFSLFGTYFLRQQTISHRGKSFCTVGFPACLASRHLSIGEAASGLHEWGGQPSAALCGYPN